MKKQMVALLQTLLAASIALLVSTRPVEATPIAYSFTGIMSQNSTLELASGVTIGVGGAAFTATGITTGDALGGVFFPSITRWDFGQLGSFVANGEKEYFELREISSSGPTMFYVGLQHWYMGSIDFTGFRVLTPNPFGGNLTITESFGGDGFIRGDSGTLHIALPTGAPPYTRLTISSASVSYVPDPGSSLLLLGIGLAGLRASWKRLG